MMWRQGWSPRVNVLFNKNVKCNRVPELQSKNIKQFTFSIIHSGLYSNIMDCLYREFVWSACLSFSHFRHLLLYLIWWETFYWPFCSRLSNLVVLSGFLNWRAYQNNLISLWFFPILSRWFSDFFGICTFPFGFLHSCDWDSSSFEHVLATLCNRSQSCERPGSYIE